MLFIISFKMKGLYINVLVLPHQNKMVLPKEKTVTFLVLYELFCLNPLSLLIFCVKLLVLVFI